MSRGPGVDLIRLALQRAGHVRFRVRGSSMRPFLGDGDVVSVVAADSRRLDVGDVICYECPGDRLAVHRLVARDGSYLVTKGDALRWVDRVHLDHVLGLVTTIERRGRRERWQGWLFRAAGRFRGPVRRPRHA